MPLPKDMPWHTFSTLLLGRPNGHNNACGHLEIGQRNFRAYKEDYAFPRCEKLKMSLRKQVDLDLYQSPG
jgi:hypothetical protein